MTIRVRSTHSSVPTPAPEPVPVPIADSQWSASQRACFDWITSGTGNAVIEAVAGAGKTTTLIEMIRRTVALHPGVRIALCAYNKKMGDELKSKTVSIPQVTAGTLHSFGFGAIRRARGRVNVNDRKVPEIVYRHVDSIQYRAFKNAAQFIIKLVALAKDSGLGYLEPITDANAWRRLIDHHDLSVENEFEEKYGELIEFAIRVLGESNADRFNLDFSDMIYHVLIHGVEVQKYDVVMVDEAQDTNATRRALAAKMLTGTGSGTGTGTGGRLIAVGDPAQAIFGFTGADNDSLDQIRRQFAAITLPLTVSYRCPQEVVKFARKWVGHIEPADSAEVGVVRSVKYTAIMADPAPHFTSSDAILCRKTAPLVSTAFALIRKGIACRIEGRDIGTQLVNLIRKYRVRSLADLSRQIEEYRVREIAKAMAKGMESKAAQIADRVETIAILIERANEQKMDVDGLANMVMGMFGDSEYDKRTLLTLSTVHKAKGREWDRVYLLGRSQFMPSKFAKQPWQLEQERNLIYVAVTRARRELVEVEEVP